MQAQYELLLYFGLHMKVFISQISQQNHITNIHLKMFCFGSDLLLTLVNRYVTFYRQLYLSFESN